MKFHGYEIIREISRNMEFHVYTYFYKSECQNTTHILRVCFVIDFKLEIFKIVIIFY